MSNGERTVDSPFSERPKSSHYWHHPNSIPAEPLHSPNSHSNNANQTLTGSTDSNTRPEIKFHSSFARCLNMPPLTLDQVSWLENELLETRQVSTTFST